MIKLSIIIVNWNTRDLLDQCLKSIYIYHPNSDLEVFVVDNASSDGSTQMIQEQYPQVRILANEQNIGFAGANNQAIRQSTGPYVLLLNPDTVVRSNALKQLISFMDAHPQVGAAGARLLNPDDTLQPSCHPVPTLFRELWRLLHLDALRSYGNYAMVTWDLDKPQEVDVVQGAALILRRTALNQVGLMDQEYFMYSEEVDLCYRLQKAGWSIFWVPQAKVVHYGGQSTQLVAGKMFLCLYQSKLIFIRKHYGWLAGQVYKLILLIAAIVRLLLSPLAYLEHPSRRHHHLSLAHNYLRLLKALPDL